MECEGECGNCQYYKSLECRLHPEWGIIGDEDTCPDWVGY